MAHEILEVQLASEEAMRRNVTAVVEHGNDTRKLVRELAEQVQTLSRVIQTQDARINALTKQVASCLQAMVRGGTSGG